MFLISQYIAKIQLCAFLHLCFLFIGDLTTVLVELANVKMTIAMRGFVIFLLYLRVL